MIAVPNTPEPHTLAEALELLRQRDNDLHQAAQQLAQAHKEIDDTNRGLIALHTELEAARHAEARLAAVVQSSDDAIISMTPDGVIQTCNPGAERLLGQLEARIVGQPAHTLIPLKSQELLTESLQQIRCGEHARPYDTQWRRADGTLVDVAVNVSAIHNSNGELIGFSAAARDITTQVQTQRQLQRQRDLLKAELNSAATYMASIMPNGLHGPVTVSSRYLPSRELGGDSFDYTWIDDDHLLVYLLDVSGHGIEPALLAVSVHNLLRSGTLTTETLLAPEEVLAELNRLFQMDQQHDHYFTMWYAIYEASTRTLRYASAGAPPALAFDSATGTAVTVTELSTTSSAPVGMFEDTVFTSRTYKVPPGSRILIYSDGASEIALADDQQLSLADFTKLSTRLARSPDWSLDELIDELRALTPSGVFEDDCSLIQLIFD